VDSYIDHELSKSCGFNFSLVRDFGSLCNFGFGGDMLNNLGLAYMQAHDGRARGRDKPVFKRAMNIEPEDAVLLQHNRSRTEGTGTELLLRVRVIFKGSTLRCRTC
jgi:hypothetical protein